LTRPVPLENEFRITRYDLLVFLHVFGAIVWIGLGLTGMSMAVWADRHGEHAFAEPVYRWVAWIEPPAIVLGPLLLIVTGVALVLDGPWGFGDTWIVIGLTGYVAALVLGLVLQAPGTKSMKALMEARGPEDPGTIAASRRLDAFLWPELAILLVVLLAMTTKPMEGGSAGFWVVVAAILAVGVALMVRGLRLSAASVSAAS
jgi:uncharacterized membrane protein